jgi:hypothetical protein
VVVSRFRAVPALTAAQVFATPVTNPARKVKPSCALVGKSLPHGFPTTQAASINADLLDFLNPGPETSDGETFCALKEGRAMTRSRAVRVARGGTDLRVVG